MSQPFIYKKFVCPKEKKIADYTISFRILENGNRVFYKMCRNIWCMNLFLDHIEPSMRKEQKIIPFDHLDPIPKQPKSFLESWDNIINPKPKFKSVDGHLVKIN